MNEQLDDILDELAEIEPEKEQQEETADPKIEKLQQQVEQLKAAAEAAEKEQEEEKPEKLTVDQLKAEMDALKAAQESSEDAIVTSGLAKLEKEFPKAFGDKDFLKSEPLPGSTTTVKEYLEALIASGQDAHEAIKAMMKIRGIKEDNVSDTVPKGENGNSPQEEAANQKKIDRVNKMTRLLESGKLAVAMKAKNEKALDAVKAD